MNTYEMYMAYEKLTDDKIKSLAIASVQENSDVVISDSIVANAEGLTFAGNKINSKPPFSDWEQTGEFHENLTFRSTDDIEFTSRGKGAESIFDVFDDNDTIAPSAKILDKSTIENIKNTFIEKIKNSIR